MLIDLVKEVAYKYPENIAIEYHDHSISYSKLYTIINKLANGLLDLGIQKGNRIVIILPNLPHFVFAYYAILKIGGIVVTINPQANEDEIISILQDIRPSAIITFDRFFNQFNNLLQEFGNIIILGENGPSSGKRLTELIAISSDVDQQISINLAESALIQYTPGVSNLPKGIELTHQNLTSVALSCVNFFATDNSDIYGGILPLSLLYAQNVILNPALIQGARLILYPKFSSEILKQAIFQDNITFLAGSSNLFQKLLMQNQVPRSLKYALSYGAQCSEELLVNFEKQCGIPILEGYGITEASSIISSNRSELNHRKNGSVGLPIADVEIKIVDDHDIEVTPGEIGEIVVKGKTVMKGYWNDNGNLSNNTIKDGWLYTGDFGKIDEEGFLYFIERKDDVIVKGGFQIYPTEIENILKKHPQIDEVCVVDVAHPTHKQEVKACIKLKKDQPVSAQEIIEFCKEHIPVYKCPQVIQFYDSFPKSATGKILKRKLRELKV